MIRIVVCLPDNTADLRKINEVGKKTIEKELAADHNNALKEVKNALGGDYSYGEIRMMAACRKHLA